MRSRTAVFALAMSCAVAPVFAGASHVSASDAPTPAPRAAKVVGSLTIPRLRISAQIRIGTTNAVFDAGVGQYPGSARPGTVGNLVIGGHRTSGKKPFSRIETMRAGDPMVVSAGGRTYTYVVTKTFVVKANAMWITDPTPDAVITLFACHPRGSISHRYVVRGVLQG